MVVIISVVVWSLFSLIACNKKVDKDNEAIEETIASVTTTEVFTTEDIEHELKTTEGIVQPAKDSDDFFAGKVEISNYVKPDENGYYVVEESQWTLDVKNKSLDEEVGLRKEEFVHFGVEVVETSTDTDGSAGFVFDEDNYMKMVSVIEDLTNDRAGLYGEKVSISRDFSEVIMYVDKDKKLKDFYSNIYFLSWSVFQCQAYSGIKANDIAILVKVAHVDTEEVLMELTLDMKTSFNMSEEEWVALFE